MAFRKGKIPKVCVCLPIFNAGKFLSESVESILGQSFGDFRLVALDDGSTDGSDVNTSGTWSGRLFNPDNRIQRPFILLQVSMTR